jgi:hypothetical protein
MTQWRRGTSNVRLLGAWAAAALLAAAPVLAGDGDVRQAVHDALSIELPAVHTETHLPDVDEPEHGRRGEEIENKHKDREGDRNERDGDAREHDGHEGREVHEGHEGGVEQHGIDRGDLGEHGEIGEQGSGAGSMDEEHGRAAGHGGDGKDPGEHDKE